LLEIRDLRVSYGKELVLDGIDLDLKRGEALALVGESGAGKTTLGLSVMRLVEGQIRGNIRFDGIEMLKASEAELERIRWRRIAIAFQNANNVLNPVHSVLDQVTEPIVFHGLMDKYQARGRASTLLGYFGLASDRFNAYPHQLSGGEQQRVLLAMAISNYPELLILDEPLSALDATSRSEVGKLIKMDGDCTKLIATHDLDTASKLADRIAVLYGGKIVEEGQASQVLSRPRHPYTRALIRAYPNMTTVKDLQAIKEGLTRPGSGCPFHPRCTQTIDVCRTLAPETVTISDERKIACHRGGIITRLTTSSISKSFGLIRAVKSASLSIEAGETLALVGQTGSGKTTLARIIMGLCQPDSGTIYLDGAVANYSSKNFYQKVQMIFQNPGQSLSHRLSVLQAVTEPLDIQNIGDRAERRAKAMKVLGEMGLPQEENFLYRYPHHLSGGEMQRVAIARALIQDPVLLIADEPTAFLDASNQARILKQLLNLQEQRGLSMLYITHDIAAARKVSDRIAVMLEGSIIEEGPANEIVTAPHEPYTKRLICSASSLHSSQYSGIEQAPV